MTFSRIAGAIVACAWVTAPVAVLQGKGEEIRLESRQDAKPGTAAGASQATATSLAGKWTMTLETPSVGQRPVWIEIKVNPKDATKIVGTIGTMVSSDALEGEVVAGTLTFWFSSPDSSGNMVRGTFVGAVQKDGSLAGTFTAGQFPSMPWTAVRDQKQAAMPTRPAGLPAIATEDFTGKWSGTFSRIGTQQAQNLLMVLVHKGAELTGTVGLSADNQWKIEKGTVDGDKLSIEVEGGGNTGPPHVLITLTYVDGHLRGDLIIERVGGKLTAQVDVTRVK